MTSTEHKENLTKLSLEELEELYERQNNILKNKKLVSHLPDKGKQVQEKLERVKKELQLRRDIKEIEGTMQILGINCGYSEVLKEKHIQHICSLEKSPKKERYKPFSTLVKKDEKSKTEKPTQLISLVESMTLLSVQSSKPLFEQPVKVAEEKGTEENDEDGEYSEVEEQSESVDDDKAEKT